MDEQNCVTLTWLDQVGMHEAHFRIGDSNGATACVEGLKMLGGIKYVSIHKIQGNKTELIYNWVAPK